MMNVRSCPKIWSFLSMTAVPAASSTLLAKNLVGFSSIPYTDIALEASKR